MACGIDNCVDDLWYMYNLCVGKREGCRRSVFVRFDLSGRHA